MSMDAGSPGPLPFPARCATTAGVHPALLTAADACAAPGPVRAGLHRLAEAGAALDDPRLARTLIPVLANSRFLTAAMATTPALVDDLLEIERLRAPLRPAQLERALDLSDAPDEDAASRRLRRGRLRAFLHVTARDVALGATVEATCADLTAIAEAALRAATRYALRVVEAELGAPVDAAGARIPFVVMGMGKLGGGELNYSSDIDLIYLYGTDEGAPDAPTPHAFFVRVSNLITRLVGATTEHGFVFRVDLDLRPEGRGGPICNGLAGAERYYEAWGRTWERIAWLRARPVAGDLELGARALAVLSPWIYQRTVGPETLDAVGQLKAQIGARRRQERALRGAHHDLKLDPGGIRAVEFFVNALQLLHAPRDPRLRDPSTLGAMDRLVASGLLTETERDQLTEAYVLYRRVEHRIMMLDQRQTQTLPQGAELDGLASRLGLGGAAPGAELLATLEAHQTRVGAMFDALLAGERGAEDDDARRAMALLATPDAAHRRALCAAAGFVDPDQAAHLLQTAGRWPQSPLSPRADGALARLGLTLVTEVLRSAEPDRALTHLAGFARPLARTPAYVGSLQRNPVLVRLLVSVFATSDLLSTMLIRQPDLLDSLFDRRPPTDEDAHLAAALARAAATEDTERFVEAVARYKQAALLRIGLSDVAGELDAPRLEAALSDLAAAILRAVFERARRDTEARRGAPPTAIETAILAFGKLGGREMSYGSDLDLVFVYDHAEADGTTAAEALAWCTRLAQRTLSLLGLPTRAGLPLYSVDTRLRPGGSQGTLVVSLARFVAHHEQTAAAWERVALVRARPVAGDRALCVRLEPALERLTFALPPPPSLRADLRRIRSRLEREVARETPDRYNPKVGRGGLMDLEFIAQVLQIENGGRRPSLRTANTCAALAALGASGVLDEVDPLLDAWRFLRRLDHRLRIMRGRPVPELRADPTALDRLARRLGYRGAAQVGGTDGLGGQLLDDYQRTTALVRRRFEQVFGPASD